MNVGTTVLASRPGTLSVTINLDASGNLKVDGLSNPSGVIESSATFNSATGRLEIRMFKVDDPEQTSWSKPVNVWTNAELPDIREANNQKLTSIREQVSIDINDYVSLRNAEILDGSRGSLIASGDRDLLLPEDVTGNKRYYHIKMNGEVGAPVQEGRSSIHGSEAQPTSSLQLDSSGRFIMLEGTSPAGLPLHHALLDPTTTILTATRYPEGFSNPDHSVADADDHFERAGWIGLRK